MDMTTQVFMAGHEPVEINVLSSKTVTVTIGGELELYVKSENVREFADELVGAARRMREIAALSEYAAKVAR